MEEGAIAVQTSSVLTALVKKRDGTPLPRAEINATTITIRNRDAARTIVATLNDTALTVANVWGATDGILTVPMPPAYNVLVDSAKSVERHRVIIKITYNTTDKAVIVTEYKVENPDTV